MQALRLLLGDPRIDPYEVDAAELRRVAASDGVAVRLADALIARGETLPPRFAAATAAACARAERALELVDRLGARCNELGMPHAFLRTAEHYPDGAHVSLLIAAPHTRTIDRDILREVPAIPRGRTGGFERRLAGVTSYVAAHGIAVNIRHGRLGRFGEHARYARLLIDRACPTTAGQTTCRAPVPEDRVLLLAIERAYSRPSFRLGDLAWVIPVLQQQSLNWDYVFATALASGVVAGVGAYLDYVNGVHTQVFGRALMDQTLLARFQGTPASPRLPTRVMTQFPANGALARSYVRHVGATLASGRWQSAARLSLLPVVAALAGTRRFA
jgi:hypothetical protein